ncbi:hypothetical protein FSP39_023965 [Pinctada imbricata]|uniref:Mutator-like transposase domain-containing protein n=1 Tax=Pinctada imbricata TaxID=66713 RepID=A0AA89BXZ6_PINIB|nr:hypothetical protein FSP39_023965 [Pinctada imbricata]
MENEESERRIRDENREQNARKKRQSDSGVKMKERNEKRKRREDPLISGCIRFYTKSEDAKTGLLNKMDRVKLCISEKVSGTTNKDLLDAVFDFYLESHGIDVGNEENDIPFHSYLPCEKESADEDIYLTTYSAIRNMAAGIQQHSQTCSYPMDVKLVKKFGHVGKVTFVCRENHTVTADTSSHLPGGTFLANMRMIHGVNCSGLRFSQYKRFCDASGIGLCTENSFENHYDTYCDKTEKLAMDSVQEAINDEIAYGILQSEENGEEFQGINILTDARHGWRRNAAQSDIVALGQSLHRVVGLVTITRADEPVSQRHEMVGVKKLYEHFDASDVSINIHGHDRNASVNKYLATERQSVVNANDTWHATKGISREMKKITTGSKKMMGVTWHPDLTDKAASIKTHAYYAMKNCNGSEKRLREMLDNIVEHYKNVHDNCLPESRCRQDENYEPSKYILVDTDAITILTREIKNLQIYKTPSDYVHCVDTHYVESFNNAVLLYQDKRIKFGDKEYKRRTNLATLDWNENVDREYTSISYYEDARRPRCRSGNKNLKPKTNHFCTSIWKLVLDSIYSS